MTLQSFPLARVGFTQRRVDPISGYWLIGYMIRQDTVVTNLLSTWVGLELKDLHTFEQSKSLPSYL